MFALVSHRIAHTGLLFSPLRSIIGLSSLLCKSINRVFPSFPRGGFNPFPWHQPGFRDSGRHENHHTLPHRSLRENNFARLWGNEWFSLKKGCASTGRFSVTFLLCKKSSAGKERIAIRGSLQGTRQRCPYLAPRD